MSTPKILRVAPILPPFSHIFSRVGRLPLGIFSRQWSVHHSLMNLVLYLP